MFTKLRSLGLDVYWQRARISSLFQSKVTGWRSTRLARTILVLEQFGSGFVLEAAPRRSTLPWGLWGLWGL